MSTPLKFVLLIIGAAILALAARTLFANINGRNHAADPQIQVRMAAADLPAGLLLREEDLEWKPMNKSAVPDGAQIKGRAADGITGALLRRDTKAGAILLARDIIRPDAPGFLAAALKPGMRAVSVPVDNVSGNAGLIQPGDFVDMILIQQARKNDELDSDRARSVVSETVVENVRVIAVGSVFQHQPASPDNTKTSTPARTVTIEVTPRAAEAVTVASRLGTLSMALRSFAITDPKKALNDPTGSVVAWSEAPGKSQPVWAGDISRAIATHPPAPAEEPKTVKVVIPREITVIRGSKRDQQKLGGASPGSDD